ncbi:MAG: hypothetical protein IJN02_03940 [Bacteroidales bacterium]|nr:hypothetical protein [Bacteroidales bacterium]MBQ6688369.1 hypothetical protein [Bacteroidales bacterium]
MKQYFNIIRIETSMDMGIGNRIKSWECIKGDELIIGKDFEFHGIKLNVTYADENELVFEYTGQTFRINKYWQVLGTPEFNIPNERISKQCRYVFFFSRDKDSTCDWSDGYAGELIDKMNKNNEEGNIWKNIPLMRELIHEFKDVAPFRSENINPAYKAHYIACMLENDYIDKRETPRLFHSLCELYRLYRDFESASDYDDYLKENLDRYYFRKVDSWIYKFAWITDDPKRKIALDCWDSLGGMLKVDPVQATPEWEDIIYEVEKEVDDQLKDEPRGMGFCFGYWSAKRAALARRGIEWRSPSVMNPRVMFD